MPLKDYKKPLGGLPKQVPDFDAIFRKNVHVRSSEDMTYNNQVHGFVDMDNDEDDAPLTNNGL